MIETLIIIVIMFVSGVIWFIVGLTSDRRKERERQVGELTGVINVRREAKDKLRTDDEYRDRVRDKYNN